MKKYYQSEVKRKYFINIEDFEDTHLIRNWKLGTLFFEYLKWKRNLRKIYFDDLVILLERFHSKKSLKNKILYLFEVTCIRQLCPLSINTLNARCSISTSRTC